MVDDKLYDLFISHAWLLSETYYRLEGLLKKADAFHWRNYSVPIDDPVVDSGSSVGKARLTQLLMNQVKPVNCVIIIGDQHIANSEWVTTEIEIAQLYNKPILGIYTRGQKHMPPLIKNAAHELVAWNTVSIVKAIKRISL